MSESAPLTAACLLFSCAVLFIVLDGEHAQWGGLPLGVSTALVAASGRSGIPLLVVAFSLVLGWIVLGSKGGGTREGGVRAAMVFWIGFALGLSTFWLLATETYVAQFAAFDGRPAPDAIRLRALSIWHRPWLVGAVAGLGFCAEVLVGRLRLALKCRSSFTIQQVTRLLSFGCAAVIGILVAGSVFVPYPHVSSLGGPAAPPRGQYVVEVLRTMVTGLRLRDFDVLLSSSFWGGFGWVDAIPSSVFLSALSAATALSAMAMFIHVGRTADTRRLVWLVIVFLGLGGALVIYAASAHAMHRNLHGRYLIGFYLAWLAIVWSSPAWLDGRSFNRARSRVRGGLPRPAVFLALSGAIHAYCLWFILGRYF